MALVWNWGTFGTNSEGSMTTSFDDEFVQELDWDSQFFGICVGRITAGSPHELQDRVAALGSDRYRLVYGFCPADQFSELKSRPLASALVCIHAVFERVTNVANPCCADGYTLQRFSQSVPDAELLKLSLQAGRFSRFHLDSRLPAGSFERLYSTWIAKCVTGEMADIVYVARDSTGKLAGFATGRVNFENVSVLGLIAVSDEHQQRGVGRALVDAIIGFSFDRGAIRVEVTTQEANRPAMRLYEAAGFQRKSRIAVFHFWFDGAMEV